MTIADTKTCPQCGEQFSRPAHRTQWHWEHGFVYCSRQCLGASKKGVRTKAAPEPKVCPICGETFSMRPDQIPSQFKKQVNCSTDCGRRARHVRKLRSGYKRVTGDGRYLLVFVPARFDGESATRDGSWFKEHRLVMEGVVGRPLRSDEDVHHRNHDTQDNRPENLEILTRQQHMALHGVESRGPQPHLYHPRRPCQWCGGPINTTKKKVKCCSPRCGALLKHHGSVAAPVNGGSGVGNSEAAVPWSER